MILRRFYHDGLAQASYLAGCSATGEALIVDPNRDVQVYIDAAHAEGLRITHVTETHIHADFLSGLRELCARTGAVPYLSAEGGDDWQYAFAAADKAVLLHDGDHFKVGNIRIDVIHTPGHTPEHLTFMVTDTAGADRAMGAFTGDFIFAGDVGRPDLLEKAAGVTGTMTAAAHALFASLQRFKKNPEYLQLWPGHGAGSACGKALGAVPQSTLGYEKLFNWALAQENEQAFIDEVLSGQPDPPLYFAMMKRLNRAGPALRKSTEMATLPPAAVTTAADAEAILLDVRPWSEFAQEHVHGALNIPLNKSFLNWTGWMLPFDHPIRILAQDAGTARRAADQLALIGIDNVAGVFDVNAIDAARAAGLTSSSDEVDVDALANALGSDAVVLDVRNDDEWKSGHVPTGRGARVVHIPLGHLQARLSEIPAASQVLVHCKAGGRSAIATSLLEKNGIIAGNVRGGFDKWKAQGLPLEV